MNLKFNSIKKEIGDFYEKEFGKDLLFVIIYGSWVFGLNNKNSDVDQILIDHESIKLINIHDLTLDDVVFGYNEHNDRGNQINHQFCVFYLIYFNFLLVSLFSVIELVSFTFNSYSEIYFKGTNNTDYFFTISNGKSYHMFYDCYCTI